MRDGVIDDRTSGGEEYEGDSRGSGSMSVVRTDLRIRGEDRQDDMELNCLRLVHVSQATTGEIAGLELWALQVENLINVPIEPPSYKGILRDVSSDNQGI